MTKEEALQSLLSADHGFMGEEWCRDIQQAFGVDDAPPLEREVDTRWVFKGLTIRRPDGYLDLHEFRKWVKDEWYWLQGYLKKGVAQTYLVDDLWMAYTSPQEDGGEGLIGIPYANGIESQDFACWLCKRLGVEYLPLLGRGSQLRACGDALRAYMDGEVVNA